jgi:hypothetical protein
MEIRNLFTQQLNYRLVNQPIDLNLFANLEAASRPQEARVMFEGRGVQIVRITLPTLHSEAEKACIRVLRRRYPDAVYLFADARTDGGKTIYHLCNDAGKQLPLSPEKKLLFADKVKFFEVTDDLTGTLDLKERIARAFETEKITKRFYNEFKTYRDKLMKFIKGIPLEEERSWYASVLLNRLMFIYFIQKRGFINHDENWLRAQLAAHEQAKQSFYSDFLVPLFFSGFDKRPGERGAHEAAFAGVPYLNGGLFQKHPIEERHDGEISIDNKVLRELLDYFERYRWYLDDRELRDENEINPDVLGFIFEKYVNQKQMGAYYTKEDITGYICRNTILPFLLTKLANAADGQPAPLPFPIDAANIERFVYEAVKTPEYLPTETEREYAARQKRFEGIKADAGAGKIAAVNDLITCNLDIVTYADDAISTMDERALKQFYFEGLIKLTVLDPTCGSGAFLFAALNILLPLYTAALQRMKGFVDKRSTTGNKEADAGLTNEYSAFQSEQRRMAQHDNARYTIVKSIIVNNLYGVDIMEEATEICKLRLFLRLAAEIKDPSQIEPLPDIDFNIKAGNTLVGFANRADVARALSTQQRVKDGQVAAQAKWLSGDETLADEAVAEVERECAEADRAFKRYHELQTERHISARELAQAKGELRAKMKALNDVLDRALAREYGVALPNEKAEASTRAGKKGKAPLNTLSESAGFAKWKESHQPFHWFAEFYGILVDKGGFDIIVGNPPYLEYSKVKGEYSLHNEFDLFATNLYSACCYRSLQLKNRDGYTSFIVPVSLPSTDRMQPLRNALLKRHSIFHVSFSTRPSKLFDGAEQRLTIYIQVPTYTSKLFSGGYLKWYSEARECLFPNIHFVETERITNRRDIWPKVEGELANKVFLKMLQQPNVKERVLLFGDAYLFYKNTGLRYFNTVTLKPPKCWINGKATSSSRETILNVVESHKHSMHVWMLSTSFFVFYQATSNCRDLNPADIELSPIPDLSKSTSILKALSQQIEVDYRSKAKIITMNNRLTGEVKLESLTPARSKQILDQIDRVLAKHYGFTDEELDFIIHYDIKYRMGRDAEAEEE